MSQDTPPKIFTLPLFPLPCVLFPRMPLQLHIFEERYKRMINQCIEKDLPFGVVLIRSGSEIGGSAIPYDIGCVARILGVQRLEDGRMNLLAAGSGRFRLLEYSQVDQPYLIGHVEELADVPDCDEGDVERRQDLCTLFARYLSLLAERLDEPIPQIELPDDATILSFYVASVVMMPHEEKQRMLEMSDTKERIAAEVAWLREQNQELQMLEGGASDGIRVLVARPLDLNSDRWQRYGEEMRN